MLMVMLLLQMQERNCEALAGLDEVETTEFHHVHELREF